jgi:aminopeptidase N
MRIRNSIGSERSSRSNRSNRSMRSNRSIRSMCAAFAAVGVVLLLRSESGTAQRLPANVIPEHYALTFTPDLGAATFTGTESIDVAIKVSTSTITLNSIEIAIQSATITANGSQQPATVSFDETRQQATFRFSQAVPVGNATLAIQFSGKLNHELRGFYLSKSDRRNYAVTQFEATDARRAFPSFDEPALKSTFDISLVIDAADTAISNGPIIEDTPGPSAGKHTLRFLTTPKMSTYLVAFLVGDFQCTTAEQDGVILRSCATPDKVSQTQYSLEIAKFALHYYNTYFGIPFPLKKLDLIAIPDFEMGAMENFGAITYREQTLLIDPKTASFTAKKQVAIEVAHEMAHQWFGDLVTMQWWDNLWLNEGFATWMENKAVALKYPDWGIDESVAADLDSTLNIDAQPTTRPIRARADTPDEINQVFDAIAYSKASHILLTIENYVGPETFRQGVHNYLASHLYGNATAEDFWNAEAAASHKPIDRIMDSFVTQPGEPLLTLGEPAAGSVSISQRRFFLSPSGIPDPAQKWSLPVCFKTGVTGQSCQLLGPSTDTIHIPSGTLLFANASGKGYYRSNYAPGIYKTIVAQVESGLAPAERILLIGDQWARLRANKASVGDYLDLVAAVKDDPNSHVVSSAMAGVEIIYIRVAATPAQRTALAAWIRKTFSPIYARLGPPAESDSDDTRELRAQLFSLLGLYGNDPLVLSQARAIAQRFLADPTSVEPTLRQTAILVAARHGDTALYDQLQHLYETSDNPEIKVSALSWLSQFEDPALIQRALEYAVSSKVRNQNAVDQLGLALQIDENRAQVWNFIQSHWNEVQAQFTTEMGARFVGWMYPFCTVEDRNSVQQFFSTHQVEAADVSLRHSLEVINGCIEFRSLQEANLKQWLASQP